MNKASTLSWIFRRTRHRLPALAIMTAANIETALFTVLFALGSRKVIDSAISGASQPFVQACIEQGAISLGVLVCLTVYRHLHEQLMAQLDKDWKSSLLHGLLHGAYAQVSSFHSGEILNRLNNDVNTVDEGILTVIPSAASMLTRLIAAIVVLGVLDFRLTVIILSAGAFVILLTAVLRHFLKDIHKQVSQENGKVSSFLQEIFEKLLLVQALDISDEIERRADILLESRYAATRERKNMTLLANSFVSILSYSAAFVALVWCSNGLLNGTMSFGSLTAITQLVSQVLGPFVNLSGIIPKYIAMIASAERLMELENMEQEPAAEDVHMLYHSSHALCARNLRFSYGREVLLEDASFSLPTGSFSVITGSSGIGKTTLLKLLMGVYPPDHGTLSLDGDSGSKPLRRTTRRLFSYVPQGNLLFSGTLRENLTVVRPDANPEAIQQAIYVSAMDEYLSLMPNGLDTVIGENGLGLSEGQAQRLAIARAILSGAPILLLDEATSALDSETELLVLRRIRALPDRTCIAVTHRKAAVTLCDWIIEVQNKQLLISPHNQSSC